ncbi:phosphatidate cytidylyltransferase [Geobacter metallireducens GS-15]|uniref:Phosphatidate cytidylyltransferase n=1 Tax=Geobacter metallireducens (strain ATCC 53774 / DSM 7210 / GS-15) TaxID=269799 RepID=Q39W83_GEOMG|nr:phosphatidate cytidylyltransferase [Geobacter metallireducens]ABB31491.2 phosphatidate cytidylyltransferase [Geobacter metallireducens GS-15]
MKRLLTGVIALPLLILFILKASVFVFACFVGLLVLLGLGEFYRMALPKRPVVGTVASLSGMLVLPVLVSPELLLRFVPVPAGNGVLLALTLLFSAVAIFFLFSIRDIRQSAAEAGLIWLGFAYVPLLLSHLVLLRALPDGVSWVFLMLLIVMSGDTAAYYVGSTLGRRKLYPIVSPNKSIEGALGGLCGSLAGTLIAKYTFLHQLTVVDCVVTALAVGALGQVGDLFESLLKRSFGVKDSGIIIPGHGGILDRLDSILFAAPALYYYAYLVVMAR